MSERSAAGLLHCPSLPLPSLLFFLTRTTLPQPHHSLYALQEKDQEKKTKTQFEYQVNLKHNPNPTGKDRIELIWTSCCCFSPPSLSPRRHPLLFFSVCRFAVCFSMTRDFFPCLNEFEIEASLFSGILFFSPNTFLHWHRFSRRPPTRLFSWIR